jgi:acetyl esterase/lipase
MIPLEAIAADARESIRIFREARQVSLQDAGPAEARDTYAATCRASGPPDDGSVRTRDVLVADIPCRVYLLENDRASAPRPAVLFLHGGGWVIGDLETHDLLCRALTRATGARILAVDYRRAPEHRFPAAHDDACAVARTILSGDCGLLDPARVVVMGDSAGGNLAAWVAAESAHDRFAHRFVGQVLLYPVVDLIGPRPSYQRITEGFPLTSATMRWFAKSYAPQCEMWTDPRLSPLLYTTVAQAPAFLLTVGLDPLADEGIAYASALASAGTAIEHIHLPRHSHGLATAAGRIPTGQRVIGQAAAFVRRLIGERAVHDR